MLENHCLTFLYKEKMNDLLRKLKILLETRIKTKKNTLYIRI